MILFETHPVIKSHLGDYFIYDKDLSHRYDGCTCVCLDEIEGNKYWAKDKEVYPNGDFPHIDEVRYWHETDNCNACMLIIGCTDDNVDAPYVPKNDILRKKFNQYSFEDIRYAYLVGMYIANNPSKYEEDLNLELTVRNRHLGIDSVTIERISKHRIKVIGINYKNL